MSFTEQLYAALHDQPEKPMMDFKGRVVTGGELAAYGDAVIALLDAAGVEKDLAIGIILRNRPVHAAAVQALVAHGRPFTTIYAMQSIEAMAADIATTGFAAVIADVQDWTAPVIAAAASAGSLGITIDLSGEAPVALVPGLQAKGAGPFRKIPGQPGLEILSSGTTGTPKRILFPFRMLERAVASINVGRAPGEEPAAQVTTLPFTGIGGMCGLIGNPMIGRYTALLERFNVDDFVEAVDRLRPADASGPPTIARMLLDAKVDPAKLSSVKYWFGGGAPFPPELQDEFEEAFGIRTLWAYGATEFCGTVVSWTPALDAEYRQAKRGSVGKALPGVELRIIDVETGAILPPGQQGYLEALIPAVGDEWIRTVDLMSIDADGFLWHYGRGDGAILRGGFKVLPEKIVSALLEHPSVLDAGVVGLDDRRLGQVPVAAVELRKDMPVVSGEELREHVRRLLPSHHVPTEVYVLEEMPRTVSLKADLGALKRMFAEAEA